MERLSLRFSGGLIKICKFNLLSQFSSFQCPTPQFALLHSKDLSINVFSSACLNKREYIEFLFDTLYLETGRIKKRKVDSSLKRIKMNVGCQIHRRCVIVRLGGITKYAPQGSPTITRNSSHCCYLAQNLVVSTILAKTLYIGALSVDKLSIKHFTRGAIN